MKEKAEALYDRLAGICAEFIFIGRADVFEQTRALIPELSLFAGDFLQENPWEFGEREYADKKCELMECLKDCVKSLEEKDCVLLKDTLDFGFREFFKRLLPKERIQKIEEGTDDDV